MIGKLIESVAKVSEKAKEKLTPKFFKDIQQKENLTTIFFRKEVKSSVACIYIFYFFFQIIFI